MPIKFRCQRCHQLLGIASRKAGSEVQCPKCGISQIVPNEEAASAALAMTRFAKAHEIVENPGEVVVYEDEPAAIETRRPTAAGKSTPDHPAATGTSDPAEPTQRGPIEGEFGEPVPRGMVLYARRTIYVQGLLLLIVAAVFFGGGYLMGRGDAIDRREAEAEGAAKERVLVEGRVAYRPGPGQLAGDENAVIIALPDGAFPQEGISFRGIRPEDEPPGENHKSLRMIAELGGTYARADAKGAFSMVVPDQGTYRLLIVSAHADRPAGTEIDELHLSEIQQYIELAEHLIHRHQYRWTTEEINIGFNPIEVEFGRDGPE